ncbi:hypothetical protein [Flavobacterium columnare]|nr:hypothetical protein [Flavobacterium columnare]MCH4830182.1 hypothetical protein [Flavobacterium columnare]MCH4832436.1 hypothetical protein [Flavobacterium columnare]
MKLIFPFFSYVFHPLFISFYNILFYIFFINKILNNCIHYIYKAFFITLFIPIIVYYFLIQTKKIEDSMIRNVQERKIPLVLQLILYLIIILTLTSPNNYLKLSNYFWASSVSTIIAFYFVLVNKKISLHMISMLGTSSWIILNYTNLDLIYYMILFVILMVLSSCVALSRWIMKAHSISELVLGSIIGAIPQFVIFMFQ